MAGLGRRLAAGRRPHAVLIACLIAVLAAGCTGEGSEGDSGAATVTKEQAETALGSFRLDDPDSRIALEQVRFTNAGVAAAAELLESGAAGDTLWAAAYVYASWGQDPSPLRPLLEASDPSIRVMAAAGLVARGDAAAFDVLVEAIEHQDTLLGTLPPQPVWSFAAFTLERYTGQDLGPALDAGDSELAEAHGRWAAWLDQNRDGLRFDPGSGTWEIA